MNPQSPEKRPSLDLPPVQTEEKGQKVNPENQGPVKALGTERNPELTTQGAPGTSQQASLPPVPTQQASGSTGDPAAKSTAATSQADDQSPMIADDVDLIEKEWVEKAKQIVEQTKEDPHKQNEEINKVKADYIKKRYNKDMRLNEE